MRLTTLIPTLQTKRWLARVTDIPLKHLRATAFANIVRGGRMPNTWVYALRPHLCKTRIVERYRVTLEMGNGSVRGAKWCGKVVDPLIPDSPQLRSAGANRCNLPVGHKLQWGPTMRGHCWTQARQICGNNRPRGRAYFTATEEDASLKRATELALVELDKQIENDWHVVRLDPTPEVVMYVVWGPQLSGIQEARMRRELNRVYNSIDEQLYLSVIQ